MSLAPKTRRHRRSRWRPCSSLNQVFEYGFGDFQINPYYARIINLIGINITLAVSLNLINGLAGQFSIGHAGFMAVGGYTATYLTVYHGRQIAALVGSTPGDPLGGSVVMIPSLLAGAAAAALAGLAGRHPVAAAARATTWRSSRWASARSSASSS